jgi:hypothetical protein
MAEVVTDTPLNVEALKKDETVLEEVKNIITLPAFDASAVKENIDPESVVLDPSMVQELISMISSL